MGQGWYGASYVSVRGWQDDPTPSRSALVTKGPHAGQVHSFGSPESGISTGNTLVDEPWPRLGRRPQGPVVEVVSPGSLRFDTGAKLTDYFRVPTIRHYLVVKTDRPVVIQHRRIDDTTIETRLIREGTFDRDPPGLSIALTDIFES